MNLKGRHHYGAKALVAAVATSVPLSSKSKGSTSLRHSKATDFENNLLSSDLKRSKEPV